MEVSDKRIVFVRRVTSLLLASTALLWLTLVDRRNGSSATSNVLFMRGLSITPLKPTIYTFQEELPLPNQVNEELKLWQLSWKQAGWDAKVVTFNDALKHPNFDVFERALGEIMPFGRRPEKMGYYRFLAMAVTGGGFLADVDVLPLWHLSPSQRETLTEDKFTVRCGSTKIAPCLMSGSGDEWNRISIELLSSIQRNHISVYQDLARQDKPDAKIPVWLSIYALQEVVGFGNAHGRPMASKKSQVLSSRQAYSMRKYNSFSQQQCNEVKELLAVQLSAGLTEDSEGSLNAATNWCEQWKRDCMRDSRPLVGTHSGDMLPISDSVVPTNHLEKTATPLEEAASAVLTPSYVSRLLVRNK